MVKPPTLLQTNKLEKELASLLLSLLIFDTITFNTKYHIFKNNVYPIGKKCISTTVFGMILFFYCQFKFLFITFVHFYGTKIYSYLICVTCGVVSYNVYYCLNGILNITKRKKYYYFILKLQKVFMFFNDKRSINIGFWKYFIAVFFTLYMWQTFYNSYLFLDEYNIYSSLRDFLLSIYYMNIIFVICMLKLMAIFLERWNEMIGEYENQDHTKIDEIYEAYVDLIGVYQTFNKLVQEMVSKAGQHHLRFVA